MRHDVICAVYKYTFIHSFNFTSSINTALVERAQWENIKVYCNEELLKLVSAVGDVRIVKENVHVLSMVHR